MTFFSQNTNSVGLKFTWHPKDEWCASVHTRCMETRTIYFFLWFSVAVWQQKIIRSMSTVFSVSSTVCAEQEMYTFDKLKMMPHKWHDCSNFIEADAPFPVIHTQHVAAFDQAQQQESPYLPTARLFTCAQYGSNIDETKPQLPLHGMY